MERSPLPDRVHTCPSYPLKFSVRFPPSSLQSSQYDHNTVPTHEDKVPNPVTDEVAAIFCAYQVSATEEYQTSVLVLANSPMDFNRVRYSNVVALENELALLNKLVDVVIDLDPDILTGWEVQNNSWGYLEARGATMGD